MIKQIALSIAVVLVLSGCSLLQGRDTDDTAPVLNRPDIMIEECTKDGEDYVCFTEEEARDFFIYVYTLEQAYEKVR